MSRLVQLLNSLDIAHAETVARWQAYCHEPDPTRRAAKAKAYERAATERQVWERCLEEEATRLRMFPID